LKGLSLDVLLLDEKGERVKQQTSELREEERTGRLKTKRKSK
jgi:hypothetical protein